MLHEYIRNVAKDDKVVPIDEGDIPALESLVEVLMDENQRVEWELLISRARQGDLEPPTRVESKKDATTWLAWARANHHQAGCLCHRCLLARHVMRGDLDRL